MSAGWKRPTPYQANPMGFRRRDESVFSPLGDHPTEIVSIEMKGLHALVTLKRSDTTNPFDQYTIRIVAKDELDAMRQIMTNNKQLANEE